MSNTAITRTGAPLNSPAFTGTPTAPTPLTADNSTTLATTAFVKAQGYITSSAVTTVFGRAGVVVATSGDYTVSQITGAAPLASPTFTGTPAAPTPLTADNSTTIATTAFVKAQGYLTSNAVTSVFGRVGVVVAATNDYSFLQISGTASTAQIPNLDTSKITTGQLALARGGTAADLSGTGGASQVLKQVSVGAAITVGQLAFSDISGAAVAGQIPSLDASKITTGQLALARGGTAADLSATGGTSQVLKQTSVGGVVTVGQLAASDLSNGVTGSGTVVLATSPALAGTPTAPTPLTADSSTTVATTAYVQAQGYVSAITTPSVIFNTPVTITGHTAALSLINQTANRVFAGPSSGGTAAPTFRALVTADFPTTTVSAGSYTSTNLTVDATGRITAASNGGNSAIVYAQAGDTLTTCLAKLPVGGGTIIFPPGIFSVGSPFPVISTSGIVIQGAGMPTFKSDYTALISTDGGTILQGPIYATQGANHLTIRDLGVDCGSTFINANNASVPVTAISIANNGQVVGAPPVIGALIENVVALGYSPSAAQHAILFENVLDGTVRNVATVYNTHGLAVKGQNITLDGIWARGNATDGIIIKSDNYAPTGNVNLTNFNISDLTAAGDSGGLIIEAITAPMSYINVTNGTVVNTASPAILLWGQNNTTFLSEVNISNVTIDYQGVSPINYVGIQYEQYVQLVNFANLNISEVYNGIAPSSGVTNATQLFTLTNCQFLTIANNAIETFGTWAISNCTFRSVTGTAILTDTNSVANVVNNYFALVGTQYGGTGTFQVGGVATLDTSSNFTSVGSLRSGTSLFFGNVTTSVTVLSTATVLPNSGASAGLLRFRDNTLGGSALFLIDPNGGSQLIGTSQITGLAVAADVSWNATNWTVKLTSGAVPRVLAWTIYD